MSKKILVIDDHAETVRLIELTLRRHGYDVVGVQSGAEGIAVAEASPPDLILLDIMMPDMDGLAVCHTIRQREQLRHLPIVMFTAKTHVQDKKASFDSGADDYLTKPTRPAELVRRVEAILARTETKQERRTGTGELPKVTVDPPLPAEATRDRDRRLIAVLGARGGAGTSTVAINLAASLADYGCDTTLIDLDTRQGHIAAYLGHKVQQDLGILLQRPPRMVTRELERYLVRQGEHFRLLLTHPRLGREDGVLPKSQIEALTEALMAHDDYFVVDLGHNTGRNIYPLLQQASDVLICLPPERPAMVMTKQLLDHFSQILFKPEKLRTLMLRFGLKGNLPRRSVESYLGAPVLDVLELSPHKIAEATGKGMPLIHAQPNSSETQRIRNLAQLFVRASRGQP